MTEGVSVIETGKSLIASIDIHQQYADNLKF